jgi:AcrR family transcriptional regulator
VVTIRPSRRTASRGEVARRRAMEAAIGAIAELGGDRVRMSDIATRAQMSTGHILYYFGRKDDLLLETLRWSEGDLIERMRADLARLRSARRKLRRWVDHYLPIDGSDPRWSLWMQVFANPPHDEAGRRALDSFDRAWEEQLQVVVEDGVRDDVFAPVDDDFVFGARTMMDGLSLEILVGSMRLTRTEIAEFAVRSLERQLGVGRSRPPAGSPRRSG